MVKVNVNENFCETWKQNKHNIIQDKYYRNNIQEKKENYRLKILKKHTMEMVK